MAALFRATAGVIFLGTPHRGTNRTAWARIVENLVVGVLDNPGGRAVEALSRGSEVLECLQDSFSGILQSVIVYSFFEGLPMPGIGKVLSVILPLVNQRTLSNIQTPRLYD